MTDILLKATQSLREGNFRQAEREYREIVEADPRNAHAFWGLGRALSRLRRYDEAIWAYRRSLELDPKLAISYADLGVIYHLRQQYAESEKFYAQAIELDPNEAIGHMNLGFVLAIQGRLREAETALKRAIELNPQSGSSYCGLLEIYLRMKRFSDAKEVVRRAFRISPSLSTVHQIISAILRAYPWVAGALFMLIFLIAVAGQSIASLLVAVSFIVWAAWESTKALRLGVRKQAVVTGILALTLVTLMLFVFFRIR